MASGRGNTFILEIDVSRSPKSLFKFVGPYQRSAAIGRVLLPHFFGNRNPFVRLVEFLVGTLLTEDRIKVFRLQRLPGTWMKERQRLVGHDSLDVEEMGGNL